jgi:ribonuclease P protein component
MIKGAAQRNFYKRQIKNMLIKWLQKLDQDGQINPLHTHQNLIIVMRHPYLKNDFATNQKNLEWLLE